MRKRILVLLMAGVMAFGMVGCGFADGVKDGMDTAMDDSDKEENESDDKEEPESEPEDEKEDAAEEKESESSNPLLAAEVVTGDVMNGSGTDKLGEYAYVTVDLDTMKTVTMEQYDEFCDEIVEDSGYNWVSIDFGDGTGLQFAGSTPSLATYGTLDGEECIIEQKGNVMLTGDDTYEYTAF